MSIETTKISLRRVTKKEEYLKEAAGHLTGKTQVFEEAAQRLVQVGQFGHAVFALTAFLIKLQRVKVLGGHGVLVLPHVLPVGQQLREMTPGGGGSERSF